MTLLRFFLVRHRALAIGLVALALTMKVLVPAGFMASASGGTVTIELCSGYGPQTMAMPGIADHHGKPDQHEKTEMPCAFSGLNAASLAAADPLILAVAIAFIIATVFRVAIVCATAPPFYLRPPLRGPPATA